MTTTAERTRVESSAADLIRALLDAAPPLPATERERVRALIKRGAA